jgi:hypothetical protein
LRILVLPIIPCKGQKYDLPKFRLTQPSLYNIDHILDILRIADQASVIPNRGPPALGLEYLLSSSFDNDIEVKQTALEMIILTNGKIVSIQVLTMQSNLIMSSTPVAQQNLHFTKITVIALILLLISVTVLRLI